MKKVKLLAVITAVTTLLMSNIHISAEDDVNVSRWTPPDISRTVDGVTTNYKFSDTNIYVDVHTEKSGIVFETEDNTGISKLNLKYDFTNSESVEVLGWTFDCGRKGCEEKNVYVYLADENTSEDELKKYAEELSAVDGIKYADEFTISSENLGWLKNSSKNNFCLYIGFHLGEKIKDEDEFAVQLEEYRQKFNSNKELMSYLEEIGADKEITKESSDLLCISSIDDRTKFLEIYDKLRSFDDIGDNATMLYSMLCEPICSITFEDRECLGDANNDGCLNIRDCAFIANSVANGNAESLPDSADYNKDKKKNVRDAAAIAKDLAKK